MVTVWELWLGVSTDQEDPMKTKLKQTLKRLRPSPSMIVAVIALSVAIGGTAVAAIKIGTKQLKKNAVTTQKIKKNAIKKSKIAKNAVDDSRTADYKLLGNKLVRISATDGVDEATARDAAPGVRLLKKGPFTFYAKCFRDTTANDLHGEIYVNTSKKFSIMEGYDDLDGGVTAEEYLNPDTPEADRRMGHEYVNGPDTEYDEAEGALAAPGGIGLQVLTSIGVKSGAVFANGPYGPGNACVFRGVAMG